MGIKTLLPFLREITKKRHLRDFEGKVAAVDASCWLHKALAVSLEQDGDDGRVLNICTSYLDVVVRNGLYPIVVFDGLSLPGKELERTTRKRKRETLRQKAEEHLRNGENMEWKKLLAQSAEISYNHVKCFIKLCRERKIDYLVSAYESDAQISFLLQNGFADIAISEDSDLLAYGCSMVLYKLRLNGEAECICLDDALEHLSLTMEQFLGMCIVAGCDYLTNIRGVGINRAKMIIKQEDSMQLLKGIKFAPPSYEADFERAKQIFLHQTVIHPETRIMVPLQQWDDEEKKTAYQTVCGNILSNSYSKSLSIGNIDSSKPESVLTTFQIQCEEQNVNSSTTSALNINIKKIFNTTFNWQIPSFPVITLSLRKVIFEHEGKLCNGVVNSHQILIPNQAVCTSHCEINIDQQQHTVLWEIEQNCAGSSKNNRAAQSEKDELPGKDPQNESEQHDMNPYTLPFKVLGSCYSTKRQSHLEDAYEYLYEYNRPVFARILAEPTNETDPYAIAVQIFSKDEIYETVGYIAKELTAFLHPVISELEVSVKSIRFCTTYLRIGFYLTLNITKKGMWDKKVILASKKVGS